jgi:hypothetical protein
MQIANPIYDGVFKYLMKDNTVAKLLLSAIMGSEVISLESKPLEYANDLVRAFEFSAVIKTDEGQKSVLIELLKAIYSEDIMHFQYSKRIEIKNKEQGTDIPLPIYGLYFLGEDGNIDGVPVVEVNHAVRDVATGNVINEKNEFIESLQHRTWIVQINCLKEPRRTELEQLLSVFDQDKYSFCVWNVKEKDFPEKYRPIIRRLKNAANNKEIEKQIKAEIYYVNPARDYLREEISKPNRVLRNAITVRDKLISTKKMTASSSKIKKQMKDEIIAEKENIIAAKDNALAAKDHELAELRRLLLQAGITIPTNLD